MMILVSECNDVASAFIRGGSKISLSQINQPKKFFKERCNFEAS